MAKDITTTINPTDLSVTFSSIEETHVVSLGRFSPEIINRLALLGLKNKVGDGAALPCDPITGQSASLSKKFDAMRAITANLDNGVFNATRQGNGEPKGGYLFLALCELYKDTKTADDIRTFLAKTDKKKQAQLRESSKVKPIIDRMKAERAKSEDIDTDDLLAELDG